MLPQLQSDDVGLHALVNLGQVAFSTQKDVSQKSAYAIDLFIAAAIRNQVQAGFWDRTNGTLLHLPVGLCFTRGSGPRVVYSQERIRHFFGTET